MFRIESNIDDFKEGIARKFAQLIDADKVLREAALDVVALVSDRVQQRGLNSEEQPIKTENNSIGAFQSNKTGKVYKKKRKGSTEITLTTPYSQGYAKKRVDKGFQIEHIDQTYSGQMMENFIVAPDGDTGYVVGFRGQEASDKADWNELRFGKIFQLSEKESKQIQEIVTKKINAILNK